MGHYDEFYEAEEEKNRKEKRRRNIITMQKMDKAMSTLASFKVDEFRENEEFVKAWNVIRAHYVFWQLSNDLLIRNPDIIVDILKDDK